MHPVKLVDLYGTNGKEHAEIRCQKAAGFLRERFGEEGSIRYFRAPARTELGGNHTDHQNGCVLAASLQKDMVAAVKENSSHRIRALFHGGKLCEISLDDLTPKGNERESSAALIRGMAYGLRNAGLTLRGFDLAVLSDIPIGAGLSSSAALEALLGTIMVSLFAPDAVPDAVALAKIGQKAECDFFGKNCGLMDQLACISGGVQFMDFCEPEAPELQALRECSFGEYSLQLVNTGSSHAKGASEYSSVPADMHFVAAHFGAEVLRNVPEEAFWKELPLLAQTVDHRILLRAMHFYQENPRVKAQRDALNRRDFSAYLSLVRQSGYSSWTLCQNVYAASQPAIQPAALALACCQRFLSADGAWRIHGGGFGGMIQAYVPKAGLESFQTGMEEIFGKGACMEAVLSEYGACQIIP